MAKPRLEPILLPPSPLHILHITASVRVRKEAVTLHNLVALFEFPVRLQQIKPQALAVEEVQNGPSSNAVICAPTFAQDGLKSTASLLRGLFLVKLQNYFAARDVHTHGYVTEVCRLVGLLVVRNLQMLGVHYPSGSLAVVGFIHNFKLHDTGLRKEGQGLVKDF